MTGFIASMIFITYKLSAKLNISANVRLNVGSMELFKERKQIFSSTYTFQRNSLYVSVLKQWSVVGFKASARIAVVDRNC